MPRPEAKSKRPVSGPEAKVQGPVSGPEAKVKCHVSGAIQLKQDLSEIRNHVSIVIVI